METETSLSNCFQRADRVHIELSMLVGSSSCQREPPNPCMNITSQQSSMFATKSIVHLANIQVNSFVGHPASPGFVLGGRARVVSIVCICRPIAQPGWAGVG